MSTGLGILGAGMFIAIGLSELAQAIEFVVDGCL